MKRRSFIKWAGGGLAAAGLGVSFLLRKSKAQLIKDILSTELSYLQLEPADVDQFVADHLHADEWNTWGYQLYHHYYQLTGWSLSQFHNSYYFVRANICAQFLRSTDFFQQGSRTDRPIRYLGYYSPYIRPCTYPKS